MEEKKVISDDAANDSSGIEQEKGDSVKYETYRRTVGEVKRLKDEKARLEEAVNKFESERKSQEEAKLQEEGQFKELLALREKELKERDQKLEAVVSQLITNTKRDEFMAKLPGKLRKKEYETFIPYSQILLDPSSGEIDSQSVDIAVNEFMKSFSDLVDTGKTTTPPANAPQNFTAKPIDNMNQSELTGKLKDSLKQLLTSQGA